MPRRTNEWPEKARMWAAAMRDEGIDSLLHRFNESMNRCSNESIVLE
jgi:hypothetical protein